MTTTLNWFGCSTFRLQTAGRTIYLDAYIDRVPNAPGTGLTASDIEVCDWIFVGHSHFDHLWGAERIIANTEAVLVGSYETIRLLEKSGVPLDRMICVSGGERIDLGGGVIVAVYPSLHSCLWTGTHASGSGAVCLGDLGVMWQRRLERAHDITSRLGSTLDDRAIEHLVTAASGHSDRGDGGALIFVFETPEGSLLFQDTSGQWSGILEGLNVDVAILAAAGRGNIDGEPVLGSLAEFVAGEARSVGARRVILSHHDNWLPGFAGNPDLEPIRQVFKDKVPEVELLETGYLAATRIFEGLPHR